MKKILAITITALLLVSCGSEVDNSKIKALEEENAKLSAQVEGYTGELDELTSAHLKHLYEPHIGVRHRHDDSLHVVSMMLVTENTITQLYENQYKQVVRGDEIDVTDISDVSETGFTPLRAKSFAIRGGFTLWISQNKIRQGAPEDAVKTRWVGSHSHLINEGFESIKGMARHNGTIHLPD